jgi:hypothetical protein
MMAFLSAYNLFWILWAAPLALIFGPPLWWIAWSQQRIADILSQLIPNQHNGD